MRAEHVLPDHLDTVQRAGTTVRKGTVAAFLHNATVWSDPLSSDAARAQAADDIAQALPALRALDFFHVVEVRDTKLRAWIDMQTSRDASEVRT